MSKGKEILMLKYAKEVLGHAFSQCHNQEGQVKLINALLYLDAIEWKEAIAETNRLVKAMEDHHKRIGFVGGVNVQRG